MREVFLLFFLLRLISVAHAAQCINPCTQEENCLREFFIGDRKVDLYSSFPLDQANQCVERAVFVVHGTERNAWSRYDQVLDSARELSLGPKVLVISVHFKTLDDDPDDDDYFWSSNGWKQGNTSNNGDDDISSFAVADRILGDVIKYGNFPNLKDVAVTGHSAGGQYTQMYALTSQITELYPVTKFRFLVLNPSNYTYLNRLRPHPSLPNFFEEPVEEIRGRLRMKSHFRLAAGDCPNDFNEYKYGLERRNETAYANRFSESELINQYTSRRVFYFLGELDNDRFDDSLDDSCEARLQGEHRLARGQNFFSFMNQYFGQHEHLIGVVDDVGHDSREMYDSVEVKTALFGI